jgi:hypothetical protein
LRDNPDIFEEVKKHLNNAWQTKRN